jgi:putative membrane protein
LGLVIGFAVLSFVFFRYRLFEGSVEVKSGIIFKKHINLPFNRIQNVKIEQPFYYRPFGYASLAFDSGGSLSQEARLIALRLDSAQSLRQQISENKAEREITETRHESASDSSTRQDVINETVINTRSIGDLAMHGVTSNRVYLLLAFVAPFIDDIIEYFSDRFAGWGLNIQSHIENDPTWQIGLYVIALFLFFLGIMTLLSIIGAIILFWGFTLSKTQEKFIRRSGLINRHEVSVPISRIQIAIMKQDWLDTLFGRMNLRLDQLNAQANVANPEALANKLMIPSVFAYQCRDILAYVFPKHQLHSTPFLSIKKIFITRFVLWLVLPITIGLMVLFTYHDAPNWLVLLVSPIVLTGLIWLRWKRWGFAYTDDYIYIRKGLLGVDRYCIPTHKIQRVAISQSYWMRRSKVASIKFYLASGGYSIPLIDETIAKQLQSVILYQIESQARSWM